MNEPFSMLSPSRITRVANCKILFPAVIFSDASFEINWYNPEPISAEILEYFLLLQNWFVEILLRTHLYVSL